MREAARPKRRTSKASVVWARRAEHLDEIKHRLEQINAADKSGTAARRHAFASADQRDTGFSFDNIGLRAADARTKPVPA